MNKLIDTKGLKRAIENIKSFINKNYITEVTYEELVELRNNNNLIPGKQYRIIDYITTTVQENTRSAGHQFDIIVTALNDNTLSEMASAIKHKGDTYFTNANANLSAWQIWYNIDNDVNKFAWADEENGKGVIYRMIDEYYNDCLYDFKNIQYKCGLSEDGKVTFDLDNADFIKYLYTFSWLDAINDNSESKDCSIIGNDGTLVNDEDNTKLVYNNIINIKHSKEINTINSLPFIIFSSDTNFDEFFYGYYNNIIEKDSYNICFLNYCFDNHISSAYNINFSNVSSKNNILETNECYIKGSTNFIYGDGIIHDIEIEGNNNKIYKSSNIKIKGNDNIIEDYCNNIICGQNETCSYNVFKSRCQEIIFGQNYNCNHNTLYEECDFVYLGANNPSNYNVINNSCNTIHINGSWNTIYNRCVNIIINGDSSIVNKECQEISCIDDCYVGERNYFINFNKSNYTPNDVIGRNISSLEKIESFPFRNEIPGLHRRFNKGDFDAGNYKYSLSGENNNDECVITLKINLKVFVNYPLILNDHDIPLLAVYHPSYDYGPAFKMIDINLASDNEELAAIIKFIPDNVDDIVDISDFVEYFTEAEFDSEFYFRISNATAECTFFVTSE